MTDSGPRCPLCNAMHVSCGGPSAVTPIDLPIRVERTVAEEPEELELYEYEVYGNTVTGQLSKDHAERIGARRPGEDAGTTGDPGQISGGLVTSAKVRPGKTVQNK